MEWVDKTGVLSRIRFDSDPGSEPEPVPEEDSRPVCLGGSAQSLMNGPLLVLDSEAPSFML